MATTLKNRTVNTDNTPERDITSRQVAASQTGVEKLHRFVHVAVGCLKRLAHQGLVISDAELQQPTDRRLRHLATSRATAS